VDLCAGGWLRMARIRTIKPEFWTSEQVIELSVTARLLFIGMWNFCDDRGVITAAPRSLKAKVLPADDFTVAQIVGFVGEMIDHGLIEEFESNGERWWHVTGWRHQLINRPSASKLPEPPRHAPLPSVDRQVDEGSPRSPSHSTAGDSLRSPSHSTANETARSSSHSTTAVDDDQAENSHKNTPINDDSLRTHGVLNEDSQQERKGKERKIDRAPEDKPERGQTRGARLSIQSLPDEWRRYTVSTRPDLNPDFCWDKFRDYWVSVPGQRGCKADWAATWRNFIRSEHGTRVNGHPPQGAVQPKPSPAKSIDIRDILT